VKKKNKIHKKKKNQQQEQKQQQTVSSSNTLPTEENPNKIKFTRMRTRLIVYMILFLISSMLGVILRFTTIINLQLSPGGNVVTTLTYDNLIFFSATLPLTGVMNVLVFGTTKTPYKFLRCRRR